MRKMRKRRRRRICSRAKQREENKVQASYTKCIKSIKCSYIYIGTTSVITITVSPLFSLFLFTFPFLFTLSFSPSLCPHLPFLSTHFSPATAAVLLIRVGRGQEEVAEA